MGILIDDFVQHGDPDHPATLNLGLAGIFFLVLGGFAWLGWRHPLAAGVLAIFPVTFPFGALAVLIDGGFFGTVIFTGPLVIGVVLVAAGLVERRKRRFDRFDATA